jgi:hypothetical protein
MRLSDRRADEDEKVRRAVARAIGRKAERRADMVGKRIRDARNESEVTMTEVVSLRVRANRAASSKQRAASKQSARTTQASTKQRRRRSGINLLQPRSPVVSEVRGYSDHFTGQRIQGECYVK